MEKFFKLKDNNTTVGTEVLAGITTFFTMAYILFVNPQILSEVGLPINGVYIATILAKNYRDHGYGVVCERALCTSTRYGT
ncbi:hypothetical protein MGH68_02455 [Erysipelothrix sp. D19-032]